MPTIIIVIAVVCALGTAHRHKGWFGLLHALSRADYNILQAALFGSASLLLNKVLSIYFQCYWVDGSVCKPAKAVQNLTNNNIFTL